MPAKKIVITGPESSGKTTLAARLAAEFNTLWVSEFARTYIDSLNRPYTENDLLEIAKRQVAAEEEVIKKSEQYVFLDTSLEVIKIWSEHKYGRCHPWILEQMTKRKHDLYLLCRPDIPWQFDPQRENPNDRNKIFNLYLHELTQLSMNFVEISGLKEKRFTKAVLYVKSYSHILESTDHAE